MLDVLRLLVFNDGEIGGRETMNGLSTGIFDADVYDDVAGLRAKS